MTTAATTMTNIVMVMAMMMMMMMVVVVVMMMMIFMKVTTSFRYKCDICDLKGNFKKIPTQKSLYGFTQHIKNAVQLISPPDYPYGVAD